MQMQLLESPLPPRSVITETFPAPLTSSNCSIAMRAPKLAKLTLGVARIHVCFESPGAPYFFFGWMKCLRGPRTISAVFMTSWFGEPQAGK